MTQSRGYGCSAVYAQCGGTDPGLNTAWSGAYCCAENSECVKFSNTYSACKPCNAAWEQWCVPRGARMRPRLTAPRGRSGGVIPGTDLAWSSHGRPSCCAAGHTCQYKSTNFYQCTPKSQ